MKLRRQIDRPAHEAASGHRSSIVVEVLRLRDIARRIGELAEHFFAGRVIPGNPWIDLLCEQDEDLCPD